jgi:hypothetical protein
MMSRPTRLSILPVLLGLGAALAPAQEPPRPQYFVLHQELAKPSKVREYEAAAKEFVALVKKHKALMPHFSFDAFVSPDFTYAYVAPLKSMADMDAINAEFGALAQAAGAGFLELNKRSGEATEYIRESVVAPAPELSYVPATPRLRPEEMPYRHFDLYYLRPGTEPEADALAAEFLKLCKAKGVADGYTLLKVVMGPEMPLYVVSVGARDAADFQAQNARLRAALGPEGDALFARAFALTRRFETREGVFRPDLSVPAK